MSLHKILVALAGAVLLAAAAAGADDSKSTSRDTKAKSGDQTASGKVPGASPDSASPSGAGQGAAADKSLTGTVDSATADAVIIASDGQSVTLVLDPNTAITIEGQPASASQLQQGQDVRASYSMDGGKQHARRIDARSKSGKSDKSGKPDQPGTTGTSSGQSGSSDDSQKKK
jgi:hypothetical protein